MGLEQTIIIYDVPRLEQTIIIYDVSRISTKINKLKLDVNVSQNKYNEMFKQHHTKILITMHNILTSDE